MRRLQGGFLAFCLIASTMALPTETGTPLALQAVAQGSNLFSSNFVKTVAKEEQGNLICSPLSANVALTMAATGSAGETLQQFQDVLHLPQSQQLTFTGYQNIIDHLNNVENVTLKLANKMFIANNFPVNPEYQQGLQTYFHSDIQHVDFNQKEQTAEIVNGWCKEKTNNRIQDIVEANDLDPSTALILANAVYFKGNWAKQFDPKLTSNRAFYVNGKTETQVPTMYRKGYYKYVELPEHNVKCIELPYANKDISMVIILPNKIDGLSEVTENLEVVTNACNTRLGETYEREVKLFLPKFKVESKLDLKDTLSTKMGLVEPFENSANFNGISNIPLKISKVVQKAFIEVNEEGSEAAAVTDVIFAPGRPAPPPLELVFNVDRPFCYSINRNFLSLFIGFIVEFPTSA